MNEKVVFLFGAGAAIDWGGPKTICNNEEYSKIPEHGKNEIKNRPCCLTHLIRTIGFKNKNEERITDVIYRLLVKTGRNANFESIINVLEDLYAYYQIKFDKDDKSDGGLASIFSFGTEIDNLCYFTTEIDSEVTNSYTLHIPGYELLEERHIPPNESPHKKYFELFLNDVLGGILGHVSKYAYHNQQEGSVLLNAINTKINESVGKWFRQFKRKGKTLRMYTLNYDRIFKILAQVNEMDVFEGFDVNKDSIDYHNYPTADIFRILKDESCDCYYNLHGSAYWQVEESKLDGFGGYQYHLMPIGIIPRETASIEIERGKTLLLTSIITGFQKVQRTALSPFRQMFSAFDRDCLNATEIYIVGYSFGDEHVNDIIRNAKKYSESIKITIIDPGFNDEQFLLKFLLHWGRPTSGVYKKIKDDEIIAEQYNLRILTQPFGKFLAENRQ